MTQRTKNTNRTPVAQSLKRGGAARSTALGKELTAELARSELMDSVGFLLKLAHSVVQSRFAEKLEPLGVRPTQFSILKVIAENPGLRQQDVGRTLSIQQPNLVVVLAALADLGWISRKVSSEDRRAYTLHLTRQGKAMLAAADAIHRKNEKEVKTALSPDDSEAFKAALLRLMSFPNQAKD